MRYLLGVPIPETIEELRTLSASQLTGPIRKLNPLVRRQVVTTVRKELEALEWMAARKGQQAAQAEAARRLAGLGVRIPPGGEQELMTRAMPLLRAIAKLGE